MPTNLLKKKLISGSAWAFSGKVITSLCALSINVLLTHLLSPEEMGAYFLSLSLVSFAATIAQLGLTQTIVKLIAESMGTDCQARARLAIRLTIRLFGISLLIIIYISAYGGGRWVANYLLDSQLISQVSSLAAMWITILASQRLISEIFRGFHDIKLATIFGGLTTSVISMLLFLFIWLNQGYSDLYQVIFLTLIAGITSVMLSSLFLWNKISKLPMPVGNEIAINHITKIASPLWVTNLMLFILGQADIWIIGLFSSSEEVALYGTASRLIALITTPLLIVNSVIPPIIAEMFARNKLQELEKKLRIITTISSIPSIIAIFVIIFYSDIILAFLFGKYYQDASTILIILSFGQLINVCAGSCGQVLMLTENQKTMMLITLFCGLTTVIMAWCLVQAHSGIGVAIAGAIGMSLQNILMIASVKNKINIWTHFDILKIKYLIKKL